MQRTLLLTPLSADRRVCRSGFARLAARSCRRGFQGAAGSRAGVGQEQTQLARGHPAGKSRKRKSYFGQVRAGRREVVPFGVYGRKGAGGPCRKERASGVERQPRTGQVDTESGSLQGCTPRCEIRGTARSDVAWPQKPCCRHRRSPENARRHCFLDYACDQESQARRGGTHRPKRQSHDGDPPSMSCRTVFQHHSLGGHAMKRFNLILAGIGFALGLSTAAFAADDDWAPVAKALGRSGAQLPGGIYRVGLGRSDLKVTLDEVTIRPTLALGSYLVFQKMGGEAMVMGDLVLLHEEVNPVMKKLVEGGIEITALHNHSLASHFLECEI